MNARTTALKRAASSTNARTATCTKSPTEPAIVSGHACIDLISRSFISSLIYTGSIFKFVFSFYRLWCYKLRNREQYA